MGKTPYLRFVGRGRKDLSQVYRRVTGDGKGKPGHLLWYFIYANREEGADIEDSGEGGQPGLAIMLGTVVHQNRVGEMALQQFRRPIFPLMKMFDKFVHHVALAVASQHFQGAGGRACM